MSACLNPDRMTNVETQPDHQPLDGKLVMLEDKQPEFIPFEIVRDEEKRVVFSPSRWQLAAIAVVGVLGLIAMATVGIFVAVIGMLIAIPMMILKGLFAPMFRR